MQNNSEYSGHFEVNGSRGSGRACTRRRGRTRKPVDVTQSEERRGCTIKRMDCCLRAANIRLCGSTAPASSELFFCFLVVRFHLPPTRSTPAIPNAFIALINHHQFRPRRESTSVSPFGNSERLKLPWPARARDLEQPMHADMWRCGDVAQWHRSRHYRSRAC